MVGVQKHPQRTDPSLMAVSPVALLHPRQVRKGEWEHMSCIAQLQETPWGLQHIPGEEFGRGKLRRCCKCGWSPS